MRRNLQKNRHSCFSPMYRLIFGLDISFNMKDDLEDINCFFAIFTFNHLCLSFVYIKSFRDVVGIR